MQKMQFLHQDFEIKHKNTFYSPLVEPNVLYVEIYPSYICNYKCFFCYIRNNYKNKTKIIKKEHSAPLPPENKSYNGSRF